jgi:4-hydroxybenzoate polyprenyltransferase
MTEHHNLQAAYNASEQCSTTTPLIVDLDGTLLRTDLLQESLLRLFKQSPWLIFIVPLWLTRGRAYLKRRVFQRVQIDLSLLPRNEELLLWLRGEKARGRRLVLATASDHDQARLVVEPLDLFDVVLGSEGRCNLRGRAKLQKITEHCGEEFDYVGNARCDLEVWRSSRRAILVNTPRRIERAVCAIGNLAQVFSRPTSRFPDFLRATRFYQWVKNLLLFVPAITSHTILDGAITGNAALAFLSFGFAASGGYVLNDLLDLEEDRRHVVKKQRMFASGRTSIGSGLLFALVCLSLSIGIAGFLPSAFLMALAGYLVLTLLYSLFLKGLLVVDVLTLALLYTLRIVAGNLATGIVFSLWLLSFAFFLFLSLAFSKRAADLMQHRSDSTGTLPGRGYVKADLETVCIAGICSGYLSSLILALYIHSDIVQVLYSRPAILWGLQPILLFYITRVWVICRRGELTEDPIQYTVTEPSTYVAALLAVAVMLAATFDFKLFGL